MNCFYELYFDIRKKGKAYKTESEYMKDLYAFLDMCIAAAAALASQQKTDKEGAGVRPHVRQLPGTLEDAYNSVFGRSRQPDEMRRMELKKQLDGALQYLKERLIYTPYAGRNFKMRFLAERLQLGGLEQFMLMLGYAVSYDAKYGLLFADIQGAESLSHPTLHLTLFLYSLFADADTEQAGMLIQRQSALLAGFCDIQEIPGRTGTYSYTLNRRSCSFFAGYHGLDRDIARMAAYFDKTQELPDIFIRKEKMDQLQRSMAFFLADRDAGSFWKSKNGGPAQVLHLYGPAGNGKKLFVKTAAKQLGYGVIFADAQKLEASSYKEVQQYAARLMQECILLHALLCVTDCTERRAEQDERRKAIDILPAVSVFAAQLAQKMDFFIWISEEKSRYLLDGSMNAPMDCPLHLLCVEQPMLTAGERTVLWKEYVKAYPISSRADTAVLANQYILSARGIQEVLKTADYIRIQHGAQAVEPEHIRAAVKQQQPSQLGRYASLIQTVYAWEDLVVSPQQKHQMQLICSQLKYRSVVGEEWGFYKKTAYGRGICALFYGSPGTGKTMAVQVIANELGLDLYRVDLSQLVSKYIGETEKNISQLFHKAKNINALLFFDEADALFSKRSEVKDSHDRNANAQTAHLLQKLEDYEGIAILATNYINNIDDAFKRRIKFMIHFEFPQAPVRLKLWKTILPADVPCEEELDFEYYAHHFELSGSSIKEILTNAAYIAAAGHQKLANRHIIEAVKLNFAKYGKVLTDNDFGYLV